MPILVKDFTWTQTLKSVHIRIPIDPVYKENIDLFTTDSYVKAHFSPFLFEIFLFDEVDNKNCKCIIHDKEIVLNLIKKEEYEWSQLEKILSKEEKKELRQKNLNASQDDAKKESEEKFIKKNELNRFAVQKAMDIDSKQHLLMDKRRDEERRQAMDNLENWRLKTENRTEIISATSSGVKIKELNSSDDEDKNESKQETNLEQPKPEASKNLKPARKLITSSYVDKKKEEMARRVLPQLRQTQSLEITHTPRSFPTPSRESAAEEEETWLRNITMARRATGFASEDLRPEEQDPQWCKEKGDEFFRSGNFLGAISAYTHGITLTDKLPSLYANRAATHFALGNFNKCANDCSSALDLMKPVCEGNRRSRAKCIARRAAALARLGYLNKAIDEMKAAAKLLPEDEKIKQDIYDMERAWEQNPDSD
ncbi:dynein axonemal assembly factor 4-like [Aricia agestis]|uniref:dynein axonemal assembly factor 4-like n=1 Tax=Aricia agestis TaxID=91739 RepID=UPI001C209727|nr:dynein axonemal assembly factor 4-like [Aricia agestis]